MKSVATEYVMIGIVGAVTRMHECKICGSHGCDYEECHLPGYKIPLHTLQETPCLHYTAQPVNAI
jgi:hypothetical protein